jgi:hypothetical protein
MHHHRKCCPKCRTPSTAVCIASASRFSAVCWADAISDCFPVIVLHHITDNSSMFTLHTCPNLWRHLPWQVYSISPQAVHAAAVLDTHTLKHNYILFPFIVLIAIPSKVFWACSQLWQWFECWRAISWCAGSAPGAINMHIRRLT